MRSNVACLGVIFLAASLAMAGERTESFDRDPGWEGKNSRATTTEPRDVRQDFGFSPTDHAGRKPGEMGGLLTPAAEPAYYAKPIAEKSLREGASASGTLACTGKQFHALIGFFNAGTLGA